MGILRRVILLSGILIGLYSCDREQTGSVGVKNDPASLPKVNTWLVSGITSESVVAGGTVSDDGGSAISERGVCWAESPNPTLSNSKQTAINGARIFFNHPSGMKPGTLYYLRAYAINSDGVSYGEVQVFRTLEASVETGIVTDRDGKTYVTVKIGSKWWMAENLQVSRFRNGDPIKKATSLKEWSVIGEAACCQNTFETNLRENDPGFLYNLTAVNDPRGLAPEGWHIPSETEWNQLIQELGGMEAAVPKLWMFEQVRPDPRYSYTNLSGFSARYVNWSDLSPYGEGAPFCGTSPEPAIPVFNCWITSSGPSDTPGFLILSSSRSSVDSNLSPWYGFPVRCVKD